MINLNQNEVNERAVLNSSQIASRGPLLLENLNLSAIVGEKAQLTDENITHIARCFEKIDNSLIAESEWQSHWDTFQISHPQISLPEINTLKKQVLKKYKDKIIQASIFIQKTKEESESEHMLNQIPFQDTLQTYNEYLFKYPIAFAKEQLKLDCKNMLVHEVKNELAKTDFLLSQALLVSPILQLRKAMKRLKLTLAYQLLGNNIADVIIQPIENKKNDLTNVTTAVDEVIYAICRHALPGTNISKFITQETKKLIPLIHKIPGLRATSMIAHLLRRYEVMKMIHDTTIDTQAQHCKSFYKDSTDFTQIQNELSKISEFRVRRNVIERLFDYLREEINGKKMCPDQERFLLFLQQSYLKVISQQIKTIPPESRQSFLEKMKCKEILLSKYNISFEIEFANIALESQNAPFNRNQEETQLHEPGSPVEINILLGLAKELTMCVISSTDAIEAEQIIFNYLKQTFQDVQDPDFIPRAYIEELGFKQALFGTLKERLLYIQSMTLRRKLIDSIYHLTLSQEALLNNTTFWWKKSSLTFDLLETILPIYLEALKIDIQGFKIENLRDRYIVYIIEIYPALRAPYFLAASKNRKTKQYYQELLDLCKMLASHKEAVGAREEIGIIQ